METAAVTLHILSQGKALAARAAGAFFEEEVDVDLDEQIIKTEQNNKKMLLINKEEKAQGVRE